MSDLRILGCPFIEGDLGISSDYKFLGLTRMPQKSFIIRRLDHGNVCFVTEVTNFYVCSTNMKSGCSV